MDIIGLPSKKIILIYMPTPHYMRISLWPSLTWQVYYKESLPGYLETYP